MAFAPTTNAERIQSLDVIRGFALLGILLMNVEYFMKPMQAIMLGFDAGDTGMDRAVAWFVYAFVQGKFYTMFSLLFGLGFTIFLDRALARGASPRLLFARRLAGLLLIGAAHAFLVWSGDILLLYALFGFLLLLFAHTPASRLWKYGVALLLIPPLLYWFGAWGLGYALQGPEGPRLLAEFEASRVELAADIAQGTALYTTGAWSELVPWRVHEWTSLYGGGGWLFFGCSVLGMFLIGAAFGRARVFAELAAHRKLFRNMLLVGLVVGVPLALFVGLRGTELEMMVPTMQGARVFAAQAVSNLALCAAYVGAIALLLQRQPDGLLARLAPAGRMALTNYLAQSIVFTLLFYGYGLGLWGEVGRAGATLMAVVFYAFQIWLSGWWLSRHRYGPMEYLWRMMTYRGSGALGAAVQRA